MIGARFEAFLLRLGLLQVRRPWVPFAFCMALTAAAVLLASRLELRTKFDQLLPQNKPSVVELHRIADRTAASSRIFVLLEGEDRAVLRAMGDEVVPKLRAIGGPWVVSADSGVQTARSYLLARAGLFATPEQLEKLRDDIEDAWDHEVGKQLGATLDDDAETTKLDAETIEKRFLGESSRLSAREFDRRYPDGYYESPDGRQLVVLVRSTAQSGELNLQREALRRVQDVVSATSRDARFAKVRVGYAGDLVTSLYEYGIVRDDLASVGAMGLTLVLAVVFVFYMRVRALVTMGVTVATGLAWTFGVTYLLIGHLNVATGFLFSIVAGNGINCGIMYMSRYLEARRAGADVESSVATAHRETWLATLAAALAAGAAYASLAVTEFRGFKHFALIGASGMLLCWLATYALTPAVLALTERYSPFAIDERTSLIGKMRASGSRYDAPFLFVVPRIPRLLVAIGALSSIVGFVLLFRWAKSDPMEYDLRRTQVDRNGQSADIYRVSDVSKGIVGSKTEGGMVLLVDRLDQIKPLQLELAKRRDAAPADKKPFEAVHALTDFVPDDQDKKVPLLAAIRDKLQRARDKGFIKDEDWKRVLAYMPPKDLRAFGLADLPEDLARPFTEKDGTRGRLVYVEPSLGKDEDDLHYLLLWADSFRETKLPNGEVLHGSGRAIIFADMLRAIIADVPKAVAASFALTVMAVLITFRRGGGAAWVLGALGVGIAWTGAYLALTHARINFLNFLALPITFGIGADYAVNVMQRYQTSGSVLTALRNTGGAVVLASLTTIVGYLALVRSINQAVRSLGVVAVMGEVACLLAAVLILPAALLISSRARGRSA